MEQNKYLLFTDKTTAEKINTSDVVVFDDDKEIYTASDKWPLWEHDAIVLLRADKGIHKLSRVEKRNVIGVYYRR